MINPKAYLAKKLTEYKGPLEEIQEEVDQIKKEMNKAKSKCVETEIVFKNVATFSEGDSFGEYALIEGKKGKRAARIIAISECYFGVLTAEDYNKSLIKNEIRLKNAMVDFLVGMPQFNSLGRSTVQKQLIKMNHVTCCKGQVLVN